MRFSGTNEVIENDVDAQEVKAEVVRAKQLIVEQPFVKESIKFDSTLDSHFSLLPGTSTVELTTRSNVNVTSCDRFDHRLYRCMQVPCPCQATHYYPDLVVQGAWGEEVQFCTQTRANVTLLSNGVKFDLRDLFDRVNKLEEENVKLKERVRELEHNGNSSTV